VNPEKTKHVLMSHYQKAGENHSIKIVNRSFEDVAELKYFRTALISELYSRRDQEQTKFRECLLTFGSESFVILPAVQECKG
jgi:hypothetical protein